MSTPLSTDLHMDLVLRNAQEQDDGSVWEEWAQAVSHVLNQQEGRHLMRVAWTCMADAKPELHNVLDPLWANHDAPLLRLELLDHENDEGIRFSLRVTHLVAVRTLADKLAHDDFERNSQRLGIRLFDRALRRLLGETTFRDINSDIRADIAHDKRAYSTETLGGALLFCGAFALREMARSHDMEVTWGTWSSSTSSPDSPGLLRA